MVGLLERGSSRPPERGIVRPAGTASIVGWSRRHYESECAIWNERKDIGLIFMGEDFDVDAKARGLRQRGHQVGSDLECLLRRYEEVGARSVVEINGRFAGVLIDIRAETVLLFNDRFGLNRIYVHEAPHGLYFSSEAKSLLAVLPSSRASFRKALRSFFRRMRSAAPFSFRGDLAYAARLPVGV